VRARRAKPFAPFTARALPIIRSIPKGKVASYGQLAAMAGSPLAARQIVRILHSLSSRERLPWQRVIRSDGSIALRPGNGFELQCAALTTEGVRVSRDGRVDMKKYGWKPSVAVRNRFFASTAISTTLKW